jgi:hypothetical protein
MALESIRNSYRGEHITISLRRTLRNSWTLIASTYRCLRHCIARTRSSPREPGGYASPLNRYFAFTLDVIEVITLDAILNWSVRFSIPCRRAIQSKSV